MSKDKIIENFMNDMIDKINYEEKWLLKAGSLSKDAEIAFSSLKAFARIEADWLKERK